MIVITLAGLSKRFFDQGYSVVKYKLPYNKSSVVESILSYLPKDEKLLLILNRQFDDLVFFDQILNKEGFVNFRIVEIDSTRGQYESVDLGLNSSRDFWSLDDKLTIYNGDTIRKRTDWFFEDCDGYIEVFVANGNHWSFVDNIGKVKNVAEKKRISNFCSSGLYFFKSINLFLKYRDDYYFSQNNISELFIAPYYNILIEKNSTICSGLVNLNDFVFCGTPEEYKQSLKNLSL